MASFRGGREKRAGYPGIGGIVATDGDVTAAQRAEVARRESESKLRLVIEQVPAHLWTTDTQLRVTSVSGSVFAALGRDPARYVGQVLSELPSIRDDVNSPLIVAHRQALDGQSARYEVMVEGGPSKRGWSRCGTGPVKSSVASAWPWTSPSAGQRGGEPRGIRPFDNHV